MTEIDIMQNEIERLKIALEGVTQSRKIAQRHCETLKERIAKLRLRASKNLPKEVVQKILLEQGFKTKDGSNDLADYVYDAAIAIQGAVVLQAFGQPNDMPITRPTPPTAAELLNALQEATDALSSGLWDYGQGQDEHQLCGEIIARCRAVIAKAGNA